MKDTTQQWLNFDTIEWDNEADLDPETLYLDSVRISENSDL